jgi:hypothetical protein
MAVAVAALGVSVSGAGANKVMRIALVKNILWLD